MDGFEETLEKEFAKLIEKTKKDNEEFDRTIRPLIEADEAGRKEH